MTLFFHTLLLLYVFSVNNLCCYFNKKTTSQQKKEQSRDSGSTQHASLYSWSNPMLSIAIATTPEESEGRLEPPPPPVDHNQWVPNAEPALSGCGFHHFSRKKKKELRAFPCFNVMKCCVNGVSKKLFIRTELFFVFFHVCS